MMLYHAKEILKIFNMPIALLYHKEYIYLHVFTNHNFFEPPLFKKLNISEIERIYSEIFQCIAVIDLLNEQKKQTIKLSEK